MKHLLLAYGLVVIALAFIYLIFMWFLMRASLRKDQRIMEEAQEAITAGVPAVPSARDRKRA